MVRRFRLPALALCLAFSAAALAGPGNPATQADSAQPVVSVAFGSCLKQNRPQPVWDAVLERDPKLFLALGDNVYADTTKEKRMRAAYRALAESPGFRRLREHCPVLATWDDHDYGINDAGASHPRKKMAERVFLEFWGAGPGDPRRDRAGVYQAKRFGPAGRRVQVILLDTRYHRSSLRKLPEKQRGRRGRYAPRRDPEATLLGAAQWEWLERQLRKPARVRLIGSSIQVVANDHHWEKWGNFPHERERLFELIERTEAAGVIFLSGDRHHAELSRIEGEVGYPLYDLTASGLNQSGSPGEEPNRHRVGDLFAEPHFGMVRIEWDREPTRIRLRIRDAGGGLRIDRAVELPALAPR